MNCINKEVQARKRLGFFVSRSCESALDEFSSNAKQTLSSKTELRSVPFLSASKLDSHERDIR